MTLTFDLVTSKTIGFFTSTRPITILNLKALGQTVFKIMSGNHVGGRTDRAKTICLPKIFFWGDIITNYLAKKDFFSKVVRKRDTQADQHHQYIRFSNSIVPFYCPNPNNPPFVQKQKSFFCKMLTLNNFI